MALRIGKKTTPAAPAKDAPVSTPVSDLPDDFGEFSNIPSESSDSPFKDSKTVGGKSPRKKPPKALLGGLGALLVVAIAGGGYMAMKGNSPPPEDDTPLPARAKKSGPPGAPGAAKPGTPGAVAKPGAAAVPPGAPGAKPAVAVPGSAAGAAKPGAAPAGSPAKPGAVKPGAATAAGATAPAAGAVTAAAKPAAGAAKPAAATAAPTPDASPKAITNVVHDPPPSATPGKTDPTNSVRVVHRQMQPNSAIFLQLKQLWTEGKTAKANKNYAAARVAWEKGLKLAGTNPDAAGSAKGFQESLAKLPKK